MEACLVEGVLRAVERSAAYRNPDSWIKPVIVRWPTAWGFDPHPEDAERNRARLRAVQWLSQHGAGTVTYNKPPYDDRPRTIRCTASQCVALERLARENQVMPMRDALDSVRLAWQNVRQVPMESLPEWWLKYENTISTALSSSAPSGIGIAAERLVEEWPAWVDSLKAARGIAGGTAGYERVVSERLLGHSKRLAELRRIVAAHLVAADVRWGSSASGTAPSTILAEYGVRRVAQTVDVAGPICVVAEGSHVDVSRIEGLARLPGQWAVAIADAARAASISAVTTIENETTAWGYVEECGGPAGLSQRREIVVYTSGFATTTGADVLAKLTHALPSADFRHWGDADGPGIQVWLDLMRRSGAQLQWWRSSAAWVEGALARSAGTPLTLNERRSLLQIVRDLRSEPNLDLGGYALACAEALLRTGTKLEQEAFEPALDVHY